MKVDWTQPMKDELLRITAEDQEITYKEIAEIMSEKFGVTFTKNSLIGKAMRLGIPPRLPPVLTIGNVIIPIIPRPKRGEPVTIYQLREGLCKWPFGEKVPYLYCGKPTGIAGCSWCATHRKMVFGRAAY